jgi:hypothetical protein
MGVQNACALSKHRWLPHPGRACFSLLLLFVPSMSSAALVCQAGVSSVPVFDPLALEGEVGDFTLACSGGVATSPLPEVNFQLFLNTSLLQDVDPILSDGVNDFIGAFVGGNSVLFSNVPLDPVGSNFTFQQIVVNPSLLPPSTQFVALLSATGPISVPIDNPLQIVALNGIVQDPGNAPEPATGLLLFGGLAPLLAFRRRGRVAANRDAAA